MKISGYTMELTGNSSFQSEKSEQLNVNSWVDSSKGNPGNNQNLVFVDISAEGRNLYESQSYTLKQTQVSAAEVQQEQNIPDESETKQRMLSDFIYLLTGKRLKFVNLKLKDLPRSSIQLQNIQNSASAQNTASASQAPQRVGWGINLSYSEYYREEAAVSFSAKGTVKTADGREIDLQFNLNMSRSFYSQTNLTFKAGDALLDPLVVNLGSTPASLSGKKIQFDINVDGIKDNISLPSSSSGFLALDKNGNGVIDDGSELFGPQSGNGFGELSKYDSDNNGWIDENDPIYENLRIWQHDENGNSTLLALGKAGVGAIYLESAQTDFKYADDQNNTQGMLRRTGVYLRENGTAGTIQHIDLSI